MPFAALKQHAVDVPDDAQLAGVADLPCTAVKAMVWVHQEGSAHWVRNWSTVASSRAPDSTRP